MLDKLPPVKKAREKALALWDEAAVHQLDGEVKAHHGDDG